jgi:hypothetical protein
MDLHLYNTAHHNTTHHDNNKNIVISCFDLQMQWNYFLKVIEA